jgi:hypothetical protein
MMTNPSFICDFLNDYGYLDPRVVFTRPSTGTFVDRAGIIRTRPFNAPRFGFQPLTGLPMGLRVDAAATNLVPWSEDITKWNTNVVTITANSAVAPDGNTTADLVTATGTGPYVSVQNMTITAGTMCVFTVFLQKGASNFASLNFNDGTNVPTVWFDLNAGTILSHTGGGTNCLYSGATIEPYSNGWFRCSLAVTTATVTTVAAGVHPAQGDGGTGLSGNSVAVWGGMMTSGATSPPYWGVRSYVPTLGGVSVIRNQETVTIPLPDPTWFDPNQGTQFIECSNPPGGGGSVFFAGSNTGIFGVDSIGFSMNWQGDPTLTKTVSASLYAASVAQALTNDTLTLAFDQPIRAALAYKQGEIVVLCVNGRTPVTTAVPANWPAPPNRFNIGQQAGLDIRRFAYFPRKLSNAQLQKITL